MNKFKVIVPVYNAESWIQKCIWSIHNQSHTNWEVLIIDNNSTDKTVDIIKTFVKDIPVKQLDIKKQYRLLKRDQSVAVSYNIGYGLNFVGDEDDDIIVVFNDKSMFNAAHALEYISTLYDKSIIATYGLNTFKCSWWKEHKTQINLEVPLTKYINDLTDKTKIQNVEFLLKTL